MYIDRKILIIEKLFGEWVYVSITHFTKLFLINSSNYIDLWSTKNSRKWRICKKGKRRKKMKNKVVSFDASFSRKSSLKNLSNTRALTMNIGANGFGVACWQSTDDFYFKLDFLGNGISKFYCTFLTYISIK